MDLNKIKNFTHTVNGQIETWAGTHSPEGARFVHLEPTFDFFWMLPGELP